MAEHWREARVRSGRLICGDGTQKVPGGSDCSRWRRSCWRGVVRLRGRRRRRLRVTLAPAASPAAGVHEALRLAAPRARLPGPDRARSRSRRLRARRPRGRLLGALAALPAGPPARHAGPRLHRRDRRPRQRRLPGRGPRPRCAPRPGLRRHRDPACLGVPPLPGAGGRVELRRRRRREDHLARLAAGAATAGVRFAPAVRA